MAVASANGIASTACREIAIALKPPLGRCALTPVGLGSTPIRKRENETI